MDVWVPFACLLPSEAQMERSDEGIGTSELEFQVIVSHHVVAGI